MVELALEQKERISEYIVGFKKFLTSETGREWEKERQDRLILFPRLFSEEHIDKLSEQEFGKIVSILWASEIWGNKQYLVNTIVSRNTLPKIRKELNKLIYGKEPLEKRYDRFRNEIKGLGGASITEILAFVFPDKYCIWNRTPISVLPFLKMKNLLPSKTYPSYIKGSDYVKCIEILNVIRDELEACGIENPNFIDVDHFLYYVLVYEMPEKEIVPEEKMEEKIEIEEIVKEIKKHEEAEAILLHLGNMLKFKTYTADPSRKYKEKRLGEIATEKEVPRGFLSQDVLDIIKDIDVIWFKGDVPEYCFEVEHTTNVREGLLRLYQISQLRGVKFFIIAPSTASVKFEKEVLRRPFKEIKDKYIFRSYRDVALLYNSATRFHPLRIKFGID